MSGLFAILLILLNVILLPYFVFLFVVSIAAILPRAKSTNRDSAPASRFLVLIPAHDEEMVISKVVESCLAVVYPRSLFDVLVIADNCSDATAALAKNAGARVVERFDEGRKSKGHAIEYLIDQLQQSGEFDSTDALVIVDADTTVDRELLAVFDQDLRSGRDWIQAYYTVANPDDSWRTRLLNYAFSLYNGVMPWGKTRIGLGGLFTGNGMCFSVPGLSGVPWRCHGLVEDMEYSWILRVAGEKIVFQPEVSVYGTMLAGGGEPAANQRRRWEFGRKEIRRKYFGPILRSNRLSIWNKILGLCDLTMPTMGMLPILYLALAAFDLLCVLGFFFPSLTLIHPILIAFLGWMTVSIGLYSISPFFAMRLPWRYGLSVSAFPFYILWKLWISIGGRPDRWVRTPRESLSDGAPRFAEKAQ